MYLKTQFIVCIIVFSVILSIIGVSAVATEGQLAFLNDQKEISNTIFRESTHLNTISIDYLLYQEELQLSRWQVTSSLLSDAVADLEVDGVEQATIINAISDELENLNLEFKEVTVYLQNAPRDVSVRIDPAFQIRWSNMAIQSQMLASDASRLSNSINNLVHEIDTTNN
jgi:hypothetical protein